MSIKSHEIGIGVTSTMNLPERLAVFEEHLRANTKGVDYKLSINIDSTEFPRGVAKSKNGNLKALRGCKHIFLFDDDCFPIKEGWVDFFINSGYKHLLYLDPKKHTKHCDIGNLELYKDCSGVFMYIDGSVIDEIGGFNENFGRYGFEHADFSQRVLDAKLYPMLQGTAEYLLAMDYVDPTYKSSLSNEEKELSYKASLPYWEQKRERFIPLT